MRAITQKYTVSVVVGSSLLVLTLPGCKSAQKHREEADHASYKIIDQKQKAALNKQEPFTVETPADTLRRRLLLNQDLPYSHEASLGTRALKPIEHWPKDKYLAEHQEALPGTPAVAREPLQIALVDALRIAARNSRNYQLQKEQVFSTALALDLERDQFRGRFTAAVDNRISADLSGHDSPDGQTSVGVSSSPQFGVSQRLKNGLTVTTALALDLVKLLTDPKDAAMGIASDTSITMPLLRGSGEHIVAERLTQAERNVVYSILEFEQFKRDFVVQIATQYYQVLQQYDRTDNEEANYRRQIVSARRSRRLSDAGRLPPLQLDQAVQAELQARDRWIQNIQTLGNRIDDFKFLLGLPPDAEIQLDRTELARLQEAAEPILALARQAAGTAAEYSATTQPTAAELPSPRISEPQVKGPDTRPAPVTQPSDVVLVPPSSEGAGRFEIPETKAIAVAFKNRTDLRAVQGDVYDAQRQVVVAADALRAGLDLSANASFGGRQSVGGVVGGSRGGARTQDVDLRPELGRYGGGLLLNLPLERTAERNQYRASLINLERAVRSFQDLEDTIKADVRGDLRTLLQQRESLINQTKQVQVANRRVASNDRYFEAGRAQVRDVLEAQAALVQAQNAFTQALVSYRVAELTIQRDLGVLEVNEEGQWQEFDPRNADAPPPATTGTAPVTAGKPLDAVRERNAAPPVEKVSAAVQVGDR